MEKIVAAYGAENYCPGSAGTLNHIISGATDESLTYRKTVIVWSLCCFQTKMLLNAFKRASLMFQIQLVSMYLNDWTYIPFILDEKLYKNINC